MQKLENALKRLSDKIAFLTMISMMQITDLVLGACNVRDRAGEILAILPDHSVPMNRVTVGLTIDRCEKALKYLCDLERNLLVSEAWSVFMREKFRELHPMVLRNG